MLTFLGITTAVVFIVFILVAAMRPEYPPFSSFELERRSRSSFDQLAQFERAGQLASVRIFLKVFSTLLFLTVVLLFILNFGWALGTILTVIVAVIYPMSARFKPIYKLSDAIYRPLEPHLMRLTAKTQVLWQTLRDKPFYGPEDYHHFDSREELANLVNNSGDALSHDERVLISSALVFKDKTVQSVMTPRKSIKSVKKTEFLGPLVLSELSALGHSRLPVIDKNLNHVVGTLHLSNLLSLDVKHSVTVEKAMDKEVIYIDQNDNLERALVEFLKSHQHMLIVIDDNHETVGLITLSDVIEALVGRRVVGTYNQTP